MDFSQLAKLGKVAGVAGIALGGFVLVARAVINESGTVPEAWRGPIFLIVAIGAVTVAVAAVLVWGGGRPGAQIARTAGDDSPAINKDKTKTGGRQSARTSGRKSPAINERG
jgi:hypothetical protein